MISLEKFLSACNSISITLIWIQCIDLSRTLK